MGVCVVLQAAINRYGFSICLIYLFISVGDYITI